VGSQRLFLPILSALLVISVASPTHAWPRAGWQQPPIRSITLTPEGSGSLIRITYSGRLHQHTRVLRSRDPIDALAVADVDNDGDLDILAAGRRGDLRLWRNSGRGKFVLVAAAVSGGGHFGRGVRAGRGVLDEEPVQAGDERYDAALPRAPAPSSGPRVLPPPPTREGSLGATVPSASPGRAPPAHP
jgi:hypothetical protein